MTFSRVSNKESDIGVHSVPKKPRQRRLVSNLTSDNNAVPQVVHDKEEARKEDEAEPSYPLLDPHEDRQHHQVQCEAQALAPYQARLLRCFFFLGIWGFGWLCFVKQSYSDTCSCNRMLLRAHVLILNDISNVVYLIDG